MGYERILMLLDCMKKYMRLIVRQNLKASLLLILIMITTYNKSKSQDRTRVNLRSFKQIINMLSAMTVEEKVAQLRTTHASRPRLNEGLFSNKRKIDSVYFHGIGMINPAFDETMEQTIERRNKLQNYLLTKTRLGIPAIFIDEAHHGLVQRNVDVFPHGIGIASSWDTSLIEKIYKYVANQAASRGTSLVLSPVVDVVRDPRWGRTGECWGEDPYLNGVIGSAVVRGLQGSSSGLVAPGHVAAVLKHYTGHGQPESGNNTGPVNLSERALREYHMEPFRMTIRDSKPAGVMASYNEVAEVPSHANSWLLNTVLRKQWGFKGIVTSDWFGIDQLVTKHKFAPDIKTAALKSFLAGVTIDLPYGLNYVHLTEHVKAGKIPMAMIDSAVAKVLRLKFQLGLFDGKPISLDSALAYNKKTEGRALALRAAEESMILLKNKDGLLPFRSGQHKKIAVIGPFGDVNMLGDYSGVPSKNVSILSALRSKFPAGSGTEILFSKGVRVSLNGDTVSQNNYQFIDSLKLVPVAENRKSIAEAVKVASGADFIILAVGENEQYSREAWDNHFGDMTSLDLQAMQDSLVRAVAALGKPYVVYLSHARPLSINWIAENSPAIVDGWYTGEESGTAFVKILFGEVNPSGKLTISIPRSAGQVPVNYNGRPTSRYYEYATEKKSPLYPFGFGLSYTSFAYGVPVLTGNKLSVTVTNTGKVAGDEIVQFYVRPENASVVQPVKALKGFSRVSLSPGESKIVEFTATNDLIAYYGIDMKRSAEPGAYTLMVGPNSEQLQKVTYEVKSKFRR